MKILLISDEVWNDSIHGNGVLSNWFNGFPAEFANIYLSPGLPQNQCCDTYFQITDGMMIKSIVKGKPAGRILEKNERHIPDGQTYQSTDVQGIGFLRKHCGNLLRLLKNVVWGVGKYNQLLLKQFIEDFQPDIIFSPRFATGKVLRLEREVLKHASCPIVAFTGDNEYSMRQVALSPVFWINHLYRRHKLKKMMPQYALYYTLSAEQKQEYEASFDINMKVLMKCGEFPQNYEKKPVGQPIHLVYAGKLYMNRWKTLAKIGEALNKINGDGVKMTLDIYTRDAVTDKQKQVLDDGKNIFLRGSVAPEKLTEIYKKADVALHVESFGLKQRYATRVSFSTKIIDCLASTCAVLAIAWKEHSGLTYLKREDAAICVDSMEEMEQVLRKLCDQPELVTEYQKKAWQCGKRNHQKNTVQKMLQKDFEEIIHESSTNKRGL
ncbi:MAG: glycosyltransferase [Clostridia bacterium]|nr:glycosyltransferase [Clostridia bacterium]